MVVRMLPKYTTNITGLRHCTRGSSFLTASLIAVRTSFGSNNARCLRVIILSLNVLTKLAGVQLPAPELAPE